MKLGRAAELVKKGVEETLTWQQFPSPHWQRIRTTSPLESIIREIRLELSVLSQSKSERFLPPPKNCSRNMWEHTNQLPYLC